MSKESVIKNRLERLARENPAPTLPSRPKKQKVLRPIAVQPRRRFSRRFFIMFAIWVIALVAALYFMSR